MTRYSASIGQKRFKKAQFDEYIEKVSLNKNLSQIECNPKIATLSRLIMLFVFLISFKLVREIVIISVSSSRPYGETG